MDGAQATIAAIRSDCDKLVRTVNTCCALYEQTEESVFRQFGGGGSSAGRNPSGGIAEKLATDYVSKPDVDGAVMSGAGIWASGAGAIGIAGFLLGGKTDSTGSLKYDGTTGKFEAGIGAKAEGSLAGASVKASNGYASGSAKVNVGKGAVKGEAHAMFDPSSKEFNAGVEAKASVQGIEGSAEGRLGTDDMNAHVKAEGTVGYAGAEAKASIGNDGITAKASAEVCAVKGEAKAGFTVFGIEIDLGVEGKAGAAGVEGEFAANSKGISFGAGASAIVGLGFDVKIDWSHAKLPTFDDVRKWLF